MSLDDFNKDPRQLLSEWLNQREGVYGCLVEYIDNECLPIVKHAFLEGFRIGSEVKNKCQWEEHNQK